MKVVAVIPVFNEEGTISKVVSETKKFADEVLVVDDGSTDGTRKKAEATGAGVVSLPVNKGVAHAVKVGLREALKLEPDVVVQLDGDGQHNPADIPGLLKPIKDGKADVVVGSRFLGEVELGSMPLTKRLGNKFFSSVLSRMCHTKITDSQSGFRAYTSEVAREIELISTFSYTQEFLVKAYQMDYRVLEVPIRVSARVHGGSKVVGNVLHYTLYQFVTLLRVYRDYKPVKTFSLISGFFMVLGFTLGFTALLIYRHQMFLGLSGVLLILVGLQVFFFGFLADMTRR